MLKKIAFLTGIAFVSPAMAQDAPLMIPLPIEDGTPVRPSDAEIKALLGDLVGARIGDVRYMAAPVNASPSTIAAATAKTCPNPATNTNALSDGFDTFIYNLDRNAAINITGGFASGTLNASDRVVLYRFMWYKDLLDSSGKLVGRCGSGIQLALRITNAGANLKAGLPFLAASSQLGVFEVEYRMNTFGLAGPGVNSAVPQASTVGQFNADSYAALLRSIDKIKDNIITQGPANLITVTPRLIEIPNDSPVESFDRQVAVQARVLGLLSKGVKCSVAKARIPLRNNLTDNLVDSVYRSVLGGKACQDDAVPPQAARESVAALLTELKINIEN